MKHMNVACTGILFNHDLLSRRDICNGVTRALSKISCGLKVCILEI